MKIGCESGARSSGDPERCRERPGPPTQRTLMCQFEKVRDGRPSPWVDDAVVASDRATSFIRQRLAHQPEPLPGYDRAAVWLCK